MSSVNRRDVVKFAATLAIGATGAVTAYSEEPKKQAVATRENNLLALAVASPQLFALGKPVTFQFKSDGRSRDLVFTQAIDEEGRRVSVHLKSGTMRVFRADAEVDEVTKKGGLRWEFFDQKGTITLPVPGAIIMAIREDDTVRCYTMTLDFRC